MTPATQGQVILLVDGNVERRAERGFDLESSHGYRVLTAGSVREARNILNTAHDVAAVLTQATLPDHDAVSLLQRIGKSSAPGPVVMVLAEAEEHGLRRLAWGEHASAVLSEPIDGSELGAALKAVLAIRGSRMETLAASAELAQGLDHLTDLLVVVLDAALPGSVERSDELVRIVAGVSEHFEMEQAHRDDLLRAARLHQVGRVVLGTAERDADSAESTWRAAMASARMLDAVPVLAGVAEVLTNVGANWDGSGVPVGVQRGQIPIRSRILRVALDALRIARGMGGAIDYSTALESLRQESGRWYDPAVVAAFAEFAQQPDTGDSGGVSRVGYDGLLEGVTLAGDLHTASGVKLLSAGTVLTAATLQLLHRRHELDPLVLPVAVSQPRG